MSDILKKEQLGFGQIADYLKLGDGTSWILAGIDGQTIFWFRNAFMQVKFFIKIE